tara:strand:- start:972 stop:1304 length:333 start_codon:yes stop_codon:yes gene_type:complete
MKLDPQFFPDQPEAKLRYLEEELTKRVQYKEKGRSLKHSQTWEFNDINIKATYTNSSDKFSVLFCEYGLVNVNDVLSLGSSDILICKQLSKDYVIKNMYFESGSKVYAFI